MKILAKRITDFSYLRSISGDDPDFMTEMIETFLKSTPELIQEMKSHVRNTAWREIGDIAHKMKPSISFMGIHKARSLILDIEKNGRQQSNISEIPGMINRLESICMKAFQELEEELKASKS